ncbi:MAG: aldo/keto reductase [Pseudomonadota bacterium]
MMKYRSFGNTGLKFFPLGLGTIWFGRQWPPNNTSYKSPSFKEISEHLMLAYKTMGNHEGMVMIDTAAAYGDSEVHIGEFLRENPANAARFFIATKWGEDFDVGSGSSTVDHSAENLHQSFERSVKRLGRVDLLYLHKANTAVLRDATIIREMVKIKETARVQLLGTSISDALILRDATEKDFLTPFDVIQMPASVFMEERGIVQSLCEAGKAIVLNSPIRKLIGSDPKFCYAELLARPEVSMILTGTRTHLKETVGYLDEK